MPTKRKPIKRNRTRPITPAALELFRQLRAAVTQEQWWAVHSQLHRELGCKPWEWPCVTDPDLNDSNARPEALALWAELEAADDEATLG